MGFYRGPNIVRNGLVLCLDAASRRSYPGSGTTWFDLSGLNNTGTLTNGPTFNSANAGSISFDGTNDYVIINSFNQLPTGSSARTINIWFNTTVNTWQDNVNNLFFYGTGSNGEAFGIDFGAYPIMEVFTWGGVAASRDFSFSSSFSRTGWANLSVVYNGSTTLSIYENSINTRNGTILATNTANTSVWVGSINPVFGSFYYDGRIASTQIYNRALSASEIAQNYNAQKSRFGL